MAKLEVKMENYSSEDDMKKAVQQASDALPAGMSAEPAEQIRDANGKLISVTIGIPKNATASERTAARDAVVNNNPGVAKALALPIEMSENFDGFTPGDPIPSSLTIDGQTLLAEASLTTWTNLKWAAAAISKGGTGSAFEVANDAGSNGVHNFIAMRGNLDYLVADNDIQQISAFESNFSIRADNTGDQGDTEHYKVATMQLVGAIGFVRARVNGTGNWEISAHGQTPVDTGVDQHSWLDATVKLTSDGVLSISANGQTSSFDFGFKKVSSGVALALTSQDRFSVVPGAGAKTAQSLLLDDYSLTVTGV